MNQNKENIDAWIEYVYSEWLNKWELARLRPSMTGLVYNLRNLVNNPDKFGDAWILMQKIENFQNLLNDDTGPYRKEFFQVHLDCGLAAYRMDNPEEAIRFINKAVSTHLDRHNVAVARWLLGCIHWYRSDELNALVAWERSLDDFKELEAFLNARVAWEKSRDDFKETENRTLRNVERAGWYKERVEEMSEAIRQAVEDRISTSVQIDAANTHQEDVPMQKVFVSYSRLDESQAQKIYDSLKLAAYAAWLDKVSLLPGQIWESEITKAIKESDFVILLLSQNAVDKQGYFHKEIRFALDVFETIPPGHIFLIPARLDDCTVPQSLQEIQWVNMFPDWDEGFRIICRSLQNN